MAYDSMVTAGEVIDPMAAAQAAIRAYCGWHVAPVVTETMVRDGNGRSLLKLKTERIRELISVRINGRDVTEQVRWSEAGMLEGMKFPHRFRAVEVELEHGYDLDEVDEVRGVLVKAAQRFETDPRVRSQAVGGASVAYTVGEGGAPLSHLLTSDEWAALDPYRLTMGV